MPDFTARDFWQQRFLAELRPLGQSGALARQWFRDRWDAIAASEANASDGLARAATWAEHAAVAEWLASS